MDKTGAPALPTAYQLAQSFEGLQISEATLPEPSGVAAASAAVPAVVGVVLDFHFLQARADVFTHQRLIQGYNAGLTQHDCCFLALQVRALQFSLQTAWDVAELEAELVTQCCPAGAVLAIRLAADSQLDSRPAETKTTVKEKLHRQLVANGYTLLLTPNKNAPAGEVSQGGTDVHVVTGLYELAGAFATEAPVTDAILVASDSDFQPALEAICKARPSLRLHVVAPPGAMRPSYVAWLRGHPQVQLVNLDRVLSAMAPHVLDLEDMRLPTAAVGRAMDVGQVRRCVLEALERSARVGGRDVVVKLSNLHARLGDREGTALFRGLVQDLQAARPEVRRALGQMWVHHTALSDAVAAPLADLIRVAVGMVELHISDTQITMPDGLLPLLAAAQAAGCGTARRKALYVNARHLHGDPQAFQPALLVALSGHHHSSFKQSPSRGHYHAHQSPNRGRGRGGRGGRGAAGGIYRATRGRGG